MSRVPASLVDADPEAGDKSRQARSEQSDLRGSATATPIVKWVGGKGRLLPELRKRIPWAFNRYYEPFAGGAALFFALAPERAVLGDANADLIACYRAVADDVETVLERIEAHAQRHSEAWFYRVRERWNAGTAWHPADRAADFLYLNRACFNGLYRVNRDGEFNVPFGHAEEVHFDLDNLRAAAQLLAHAELRADTYERTLAGATAGDLVYLDPPYDETFNAYTSEGTFDQELLALTVHDLVRRGCHVLVSNSDTRRVRELYDGLEIEVVRGSRSVSADGEGRGEVNELLITNRKAIRMKRQQEIAGTERAGTDPDIEDALYAWFDAQEEAKAAADKRNLKHASLLLLVQQSGREFYPYVDPKTGKKKRIRVKNTPKVVTERDVYRRRDEDAEIEGEEVERDDDKVESRRVRRTAEHDRAADPFAATRAGLIEEAEKRQAAEEPLKASIGERTKKGKRGRKPKKGAE